MSQFFWESVQRARSEHFCYQCHNWIQPGEIYRRVAWAARKGSYHIMKEHYDPGCPPDYAELEVLERMREERVARGHPIAFEVRLKEVVVLLRNGTPTSEIESEIVPVTISPTIFPPVYKDEEDVPF